MLNYLEQFLEKLEWWSMKALIGIGLVFAISMAVGIIYVIGDMAKDEIIGYTDHGVIIRESDLEVEDE